MSKQFSMDDYIDVAERIIAFNQKYPEGTLQTINWKVTEVGDRTFIVYRAAAYRTPDDRRPGHGSAWEPFPGPTPYTKDSELMNAETAAWGRAIVACGLPASRKVASKQEVKARQGNGSTPQPTAQPAQQTERPASASQRGMLNARAAGKDEKGKQIHNPLAPSEFANALLAAAGSDTRDFESQEHAQQFVHRNLDRLPARLVNPVLDEIARLHNDAVAS
jgi:hypothetical protein